MKYFFLLATIAMITVKMSFTHFHSSSCQGNIFLHQTGKITEENLSQFEKLYLVSIAKNKYPSIRVKMYQTRFLFLPLFVLYLLSGCDLFNMPCLFKISLMANLDILCSNPLNLKNKIARIEQKKIFCGPSKI